MSGPAAPEEGPPIGRGTAGTYFDPAAPPRPERDHCKHCWVRVPWEGVQAGFGHGDRPDVTPGFLFACGCERHPNGDPTTIWEARRPPNPRTHGCPNPIEWRRLRFRALRKARKASLSEQEPVPGVRRPPRRAADMTSPPEPTILF
jgi:hypothetical protein